MKGKYFTFNSLRWEDIIKERKISYSNIPLENITQLIINKIANSSTIHPMAVKSTDLRSQTLRWWQSRWSKEMRRRWTGRFISSIEVWLRRNVGETNYLLTTFLSGHGYIRQYLSHMGKVIDPGGIYCEKMSDEWVMSKSKNMSIEQIGEITPENIVNEMLESDAKWNRVSRFVEGVLHRKKVDLDTIRRNDTWEDKPVAWSWFQIWRTQTWESRQWSLTAHRSGPFSK